MITLNLWKCPPTPHQRPKNEHDEAHINSLDAKVHNQDLDPKASFSLMSLFSSYLLLHISQLTGKWPYNQSGLARCEHKWRVSFLAEAVKSSDTALRYFFPSMANRGSHILYMVSRQNDGKVISLRPRQPTRDVRPEWEKKNHFCWVEPLRFGGCR